MLVWGGGGGRRGEEGGGGGGGGGEKEFSLVPPHQKMPVLNRECTRNNSTNVHVFLNTSVFFRLILLYRQECFSVLVFFALENKSHIFAPPLYLSGLVRKMDWVNVS